MTRSHARGWLRTRSVIVYQISRDDCQTLMPGAELRFHGESWGREAQILRDGVMVIARRFGPRRLAVQRAEEEQRSLEKPAGKQ